MHSEAFGLKLSGKREAFIAPTVQFSVMHTQFSASTDVHPPVDFCLDQ
jgi:hypothetical protein